MQATGPALTQTVSSVLTRMHDIAVFEEGGKPCAPMRNAWLNSLLKRFADSSYRLSIRY